MKSLQVDGLVVMDQSPMPWAYVPFEADMTVLFGLNGAGKSFLLEAWRSCLTGEHVGRAGTGVALLGSLLDECLPEPNRIVT